MLLKAVKFRLCRLFEERIIWAGLESKITPEEYTAHFYGLMEMFLRCKVMKVAEKLDLEVKAAPRREPYKDWFDLIPLKDALNGGRAAKAAGMKCIMVPKEQIRQEALSIGVSQVLHSIEEFRPEEYGLPPYD
ncbi:unnamed protein product [Strongylus vulgaris]|uniref:Uncharacterized protein n=1 Tax=Strongylus vulgaris TaxID=40348 RepID=A0A3P7LWB1_STRVU|nr:unnamed protein product [Strongylus vulgaris]